MEISSQCYHVRHKKQNKRILKQTFEVKFLKLLLLTKKNLIPKKNSKCFKEKIQMSGKNVRNTPGKKDYL